MLRSRPQALKKQLCLVRAAAMQRSKKFISGLPLLKVRRAPFQRNQADIF